MKEDKRKLQIIKLRAGAEVMIDLASQTVCKSCGVKIWWVETKNKKQMPVNLCGAAEWESHFASCKQAGKWRKKDFLN